MPVLVHRKKYLGVQNKRKIKTGSIKMLLFLLFLAFLSISVSPRIDWLNEQKYLFRIQNIFVEKTSFFLFSMKEFVKFLLICEILFVNFNFIIFFNSNQLLTSSFLTPFTKNTTIYLFEFSTLFCLCWMMFLIAKIYCVK